MQQALTREESAEQEREMERMLELLMRGLSACCEAPFDTSRVIPKGKSHAGHGPRYCSKCGKFAYMV